MKPRAGPTSIVVALTLHEAQETLLLKKTPQQIRNVWVEDARSHFFGKLCVDFVG